MSGKKLLIYFGILLLVAGAYISSEYFHARQDAREQAAKKVFNFKADDLRTLTLKSDKGELTLEKVPVADPPTATPPASQEGKPVPTEWRLIRPISGKTDDLTMTSLLTALAELKVERQLDDVPPDKLADFGLEKPLFQVDLEAAGQTHQLRFGHKAPGDQNVYVLKDSDPKVLLVRQADKETLNRTLTALRSKTIFTLPPDKITEVRLIRDQNRLTFRRTEPSLWTSGEALKAKLRSDKINALLGQLVRTKALEFVAEKADDLKKYGLSPAPTLRLTLLSGYREETLVVGSQQGERHYAQISGTNPVILVDKALVASLPHSYDSLEERRLWTGSEAEVQKLSWGEPDRQVTAVRDQKGWTIQAPDAPARQESPGKVSLTLWRLKDLEFIKLLPPNEVKPAAPLFRLELVGSENQPLFRLEQMPGGNDQVQVAVMAGEKTLTALVAAQTLAAVKEQLQSLAAPPAKP